jgi:hypothetical protein
VDIRDDVLEIFSGKKVKLKKSFLHAVYGTA